MLLFLFVGAIGLTLRFIILDKFEWQQLFLVLLFLVTAIAFWFIHRWMLKKDVNYEPTESDHRWNTYMRERFSTGKKYLYQGSEKKGEYQRFYDHWWQHMINEIIAEKGIWYLNLSLQMIDGDFIYFIQQKKKKKFRVSETWHILKDDQLIGKITTDFSMKNAAKSNEGLFLQLHDQAYYFKSLGVGSKTEIILGDHVIGEGKRSDVGRYQYNFEVTEGYEDIESFLMMTFIVFNYVHKQ